MEGFDEPWWIAGGWAIDCFLGERTRPHADLEISVLRSSLPALFEHLRDWDARLMSDGTLTPWTSIAPRSVHQVWARRGDGDAPTWREFARDPSMLDVLIDEGEHERWVSRRDRSITLPLSDLGAHLADGTPYIRIEVQLLYKAKYQRWKDERDFARVLPLLDRDGRTRLRLA
jgi:hypothetical protein